jgi:hypothetical protein
MAACLMVLTSSSDGVFESDVAKMIELHCLTNDEESKEVTMQPNSGSVLRRSIVPRAMP